jgi:hypothetical protein
MVRVEEGEEEKVRLLDSPEHDRQQDIWPIGTDLLSENQSDQ